MRSVRQPEATDSAANVSVMQASAEVVSRTMPVAEDDEEILDEDLYKRASKKTHRIGPKVKHGDRISDFLRYNVAPPEQRWRLEEAPEFEPVCVWSLELGFYFYIVVLE